MVSKSSVVERMKQDNNTCNKVQTSGYVFIAGSHQLFLWVDRDGAELPCLGKLLRVFL